MINQTHRKKELPNSPKVDVCVLFVVRVMKKLVILEVHDPRVSTTGRAVEVPIGYLNVEIQE